MKRCLMVCTGIMLVIVFGTAGVSFAQAQPQPGIPMGNPTTAPLPHNQVKEGMPPGALNTGSAPTGTGTQFQGPTVTQFGGGAVAPTQAPATPMMGNPLTAPIQHNQVKEGMPPGALNTGTPPTGAGAKFEGPAVTQFGGSSFPGTLPSPATPAPAK